MMKLIHFKGLRASKILFLIGKKKMFKFVDYCKSIDISKINQIFIIPNKKITISVKTSKLYCLLVKCYSFLVNIMLHYTMKYPIVSF